MNPSSGLKMVIIWVLLEVYDYVSAGPLPTTTDIDRRTGQEATLYYMFGFWGMNKRTYFLVVTSMIALSTFLGILFFAIWTFITEAREFDEIRRKRLAREQGMEMETTPTPQSPSSPAAVSEAEPDLDPPPPTEGQLHICRSASFDNLHLSKVTLSTAPLSRSKSMGAFNNEMGDSIQINDLTQRPQ